MSLYDKASLIMTPSGAKATKLYSHKPHNGNGDFTHDRNAGTATRVNKDGYIEAVAADVPRLDYPLIDGVVQDCPALLLEPAATNLIQYSEDLTQWSTNEDVTITSNNIISPDGTLNADKFEFTADGHIRANNSQLTFVNDYAFSIFIKKGNSRYVTLAARFFTSPLAIGFDLDTETSQSGGIIEKYPNDWYRLSITNNVTGDADRTGVFYVYLPYTLGSKISVSGNYAYAWGAQVVEGSYPTSYIPNDGTTATVTRNADVCNSAGTSAEFNDSEGVLYAEIAALANDGGNRQISISNGGTTERIYFGFRTNSNEFILSSKDSSYVIDTVSDVTNFNKYAFKYKSSSFKAFINGFDYDLTLDGGLLPTGLDTLNFDNGAGNNDFYGKTKEIATFKEALTDSELEQLTSWDSFTEMATSQEYSIR